MDRPYEKNKKKMIKLYPSSACDYLNNFLHSYLYDFFVCNIHSSTSSIGFSFSLLCISYYMHFPARIGIGNLNPAAVRRACVCVCVNNARVCMYLSNIQQWLNFCTPRPNKRKIFAAFSCVFVYECVDVCKQMAKQKRTKLLMLLAVLLTHTSKMYTYILYTGAHAFSFRYYFFLLYNS